MSTATVTPVVSTSAQGKGIELPKLSSEQLAVLYAPQTIVNNLWPEVAELVDAGFGIQDEYENPTKYAVETIGFAMRAYVKQSARATVAEYERAINQWSTDHPTSKISREEIATMLLDTRGGKAITKRMNAAKELLKSLK